MLANHPIASWLSAYDFEDLTVSTAAVGLNDLKVKGNLSSDNLGPGKMAYITNAIAAVRYRWDADPSSTVGHVLGAGETLWMNGPCELTNVKFIRHSAETSDAILSVTYLR